jgi:hypothetical protein
MCRLAFTHLIILGAYFIYCRCKYVYCCEASCNAYDTLHVVILSDVASRYMFPIVCEVKLVDFDVCKFFAALGCM